MICIYFLFISYRLSSTTLQYCTSSEPNKGEVRGMITLSSVINCWFMPKNKTIEIECPERGISLMFIILKIYIMDFFVFLVYVMNILCYSLY